MLPSGLASISSRLDDVPNVRGAIDMAERLRRAEALSALAEMDAPLIGCETEFATMQDLDVREGDDGATVARKFRASLAYAKAAAAACRDDLGSAIDRHAQLAVSAGHQGQDRR